MKHISKGPTIPQLQGRAERMEPEALGPEALAATLACIVPLLPS